MASKYRATAMRARDLDRALTATALDRAYADGQLSFGEHRLRSERARTAVTLDELRRIVADLQLDVDLPEPEIRRSTPRPRLLLALGSVVVVAAGLAVFFATREDAAPPAVAVVEPAPAPKASMPLPDNVTPIVARPFVFDTAAGLDDFRARYVDRFGGAEVVELSLQLGDDDRADVYRISADGRRERVFVAGGFEVYATTDLLDPNETPFDWTLVDNTVVAGLIAGTPEAVGVPEAVVDYVRIETDDGVPRISVTAYDADRRGGRVETDPAGNVLSVSRSTG